MTRAERVDRYREKKARRTDGGAVRYIARQQNAHRCPSCLLCFSRRSGLVHSAATSCRMLT